MPNFQNNFGTNLTSNTTAGATTSPINSIPTVDAPYYIAFDATNLNSHYEVLLVTSDTATNVNHAATTYDHTTDEEVRMVAPAAFLNTIQQLPEGGMFNGKIVPSVASDNLTVALKTKAGTDPSATDPVYVMIGGVLRSITSALSKTSNAGANYFNAGSAELATKEIDYFVYLLFKSSDSTVHIGYGRKPSFTIGSDIDYGTATVEHHLEASGAPGTTDPLVNIGRFAATLSAGAGYTWTVPTFTASNLIQRPIFETRRLDWTPTRTYSGGTADPSPITTRTHYYQIKGNSCYISEWTYSADPGTGARTSVSITLPFSEYGNRDCLVCFNSNNAALTWNAARIITNTLYCQPLSMTDNVGWEHWFSGTYGI